MSARILFVDDDENILAAYKRRLRRHFDIHTALSGNAGLSSIKEKGPYAVVISDLRMPGMDGFAFLSKVNEISPGTACIMLSGHADLQASLKAINEGHIFRFLTKPCKINILSSAISAGIEQYNRNQEKSGSIDKIAGPHLSKKILIADDNPELLSSLANTLKVHSEVDVLTSENYSITLRILSLIKIDYMVVNLDSRVINGIKLINHIKNSEMDIPFIAIAWHFNKEATSIIEESGCSYYFEKPLNNRSLTEKIIEDLFTGPKGIIDGISISSFLQMIEMEEKTCTLKIKSADKTGYMYFLKGNLIDAETGGMDGEQASFVMINWVKAAIEIENSCRKQTRKITSSLMQILMEAAKIKDEMHKSEIH